MASSKVLIELQMARRERRKVYVHVIPCSCDSIELQVDNEKPRWFRVAGATFETNGKVHCRLLLKADHKRKQKEFSPTIEVAPGLTMRAVEFPKWPHDRVVPRSGDTVVTPEGDMVALVEHTICIAQREHSVRVVGLQKEDQVFDVAKFEALIVPPESFKG